MKVIKILMILSFIMITASTNTVFAQDSAQDNLIYKQNAPDKIWHSIVLNYNPGPYYYYTFSTHYGVYHGYLAIDWNSSYGNNYIYRGYMYPQNRPIPAPARKIEEEL